MTTLKSLMPYWHNLAIDFGANQMSLTTFARRAEAEGLMFLTVTLPALGKCVDKSLTSLQLEIPDSVRFKKKSKTTALPMFLNELFVKIYDNDGVLKDEPSTAIYIKRLRQLLFLFYKLETPFTPEMELAACQKFIDTDDTVKTDHWPKRIDLVRGLFQSLFPSNPLDIRAHHSNGKTADGVDNVQKLVLRRWIPSLMKVFNLSYLFNGRTHYNNWVESNKLVHTPFIPAKFTIVPKDSRGPRGICMEPHEKMFFQKGLMQKLYDHIETDSPAKGYVNFTDQTVNRRLAQKGSLDKSFATIDLKDASDMVSWNLILTLAPLEWIAALSATRSTHVQMPSKFRKEPFHLKKFAPMGSALCFPIEAMLFWSIARTICDEVWVYGDDIVVPNAQAQDVMSALEEYGLIVNRDKSLYTGHFRESCGGEYFHGHDISIVKIKSMDLVSQVAFCNNITLHYGEETSRLLIGNVDLQCQRTIIRREPLDTIERMEPLVYYTSYTSGNVLLQRRFDAEVQQWQLRSLTEKIRFGKNRLVLQDDLYFNWLTNSEKSSSPQEDHDAKLIAREWGPCRKDIGSTEHLCAKGGAYSPRLPNTCIKFGWATTFVELA